LPFSFKGAQTLLVVTAFAAGKMLLINSDEILSSCNRYNDITQKIKQYFYNINKVKQKLTTK